MNCRCCIGQHQRSACGDTYYYLYKEFYYKTVKKRKARELYFNWYSPFFLSFCIISSQPHIQSGSRGISDPDPREEKLASSSGNLMSPSKASFILLILLKSSKSLTDHLWSCVITVSIKMSWLLTRKGGHSWIKCLKVSFPSPQNVQRGLMEESILLQK